MSLEVISDRRIEANRRNAALSTGPRSVEGKARVSRNAIKHGLFARDILLPEENAEEFDAFKDGMLRRLNPREFFEQELCDQIIADWWRLRRFRAAELDLFRRTAKEMREPKATWQVRNPVPVEPTAGSMLAKLIEHEDGAFDRLARHEQRLKASATRCFNQLMKLQEKPLIGCLDELTGMLLPADHPSDEETAESESVETNPSSTQLVAEVEGAFIDPPDGSFDELDSASGAYNEFGEPVFDETNPSAAQSMADIEPARREWADCPPEPRLRELDVTNPTLLNRVRPPTD